MVRFSDDAEKASEMKAGEYLFKIYEVNEKTSQAGNDYWQVKFESNFPKDELTPDDILGQFIYVNTVKDKDSEFLKCPWSASGYRKFEGKAKAKPAKKVEETEQDPF